MRRITQFLTTLILASCSVVLMVTVLSLFILGTFMGLFKELFKYYSTMLRIGISEFKMSKSAETIKFQEEARKIFKLRISNGVKGS